MCMNPDRSRAGPGRSLMKVTHSFVRLVRTEMKILWLKHKMEEGGIKCMSTWRAVQIG